MHHELYELIIASNKNSWNVFLDGFEITIEFPAWHAQMNKGKYDDVCGVLYL